MRTCLVLGVVVLALGACTKDNPHACGDGDPCTDPALPFCDLDGLVAGTPGACIAGDCTPGAFAACNGDQAIQCNAAGDNYDNVVCELGCDPASNGCRLCNPNETACTNGITATCDASGAIVDMTPCPLGCFECEPRCRLVDPSNELAMYLDAAQTAPDVDLPDGTVIDTINGTITPPGSGPLPVASFLVAAPTDGVEIRVFVVGSWHSADLGVAPPGTLQSVPAIAVVSARDVVFGGGLDLSLGYVTPGSLITGPCTRCVGPGAVEQAI